MKPILAILLVVSLSAEGRAQNLEEMAGDRHRISVTHESESTGDGSSSSSRGGHEYIERIVGVRPDGTERVYDLPLEPSDDQRPINWHFPVRVFQPYDGSMQLLNREEMEARRDAWLKAAKISPEACGSWYFTWSAFQVECDPESVLATIEALNIQPLSLEDGELLHHPAALEPARLALQKSVGDGATYRVQMTIDPDAVHREDARTDVVLGEIMQEPISFEEAYVERQNEKIGGVMEVFLEADPNGRVWRRTTSTEITRVEADGQVERQSSKEVIRREALSRDTP